MLKASVVKSYSIPAFPTKWILKEGLSNITINLYPSAERRNLPGSTGISTKFWFTIDIEPMRWICDPTTPVCVDRNLQYTFVSKLTHVHLKVNNGLGLVMEKGIINNNFFTYLKGK